MKAQRRADWYCDYWLASFGATTAPGRSERVAGEVSHEHVPRYLAGTKKTASDWWRTGKPVVRGVPSEAGVLLLADARAEKPYPDENELGGWHSEHSQDRILQGSTCLTARESSQAGHGPVGFPLVAKTEKSLAPKPPQENRRSLVSKHRVGPELSKQAGRKRMPLRFVRFAVWCAAAETLPLLRPQAPRAFLCPRQTQRKGALSQADQQPGRSGRVDPLDLEAQATQESSLAGVDFPLGLLKPVFTTADGSGGLRSLVSSDTTWSFADVTTTSHRRGDVEWYPKSLKPHGSLAKSPTQTVTTQTHHFFAALWGFLKWARLKMPPQLNHLTLKSKLYLNALRSAFSTLRQLTSLPNPA